MIFFLLFAVLTIDDSGRVRSTDSFRGAPVIVAPIYCRCPLACPLIAKGLKRGIAESAAPPSSYRVVLFSMDPRDTPDDLRRFRERHALPLSWTLVAAKNPHEFLDALGYRYADANGLFAHPNEVVVLDAALRPVKVLLGTEYSGRQIDDALAIARGRADWVGRYGGVAIAALLFVAMMAVVYLVTLLGGEGTTPLLRRPSP